MKSSRFVASIILTTATVVGLSSVAFAGESNSGLVAETFAPLSNSLKPKYIVPYARSDSDPTWTETVITLHNMGKDECEADIRYYNRHSNGLRGV